MPGKRSQRRNQKAGGNCHTPKVRRSQRVGKLPHSKKTFTTLAILSDQ